MSFIKLTENDRKIALRPEVRAEYAEELASINQFLHDQKAFETIDILNKNLKEITKHELTEQNLQYLKQISKFLSSKNKKDKSNQSFPRNCPKLQKRHGTVFFLQCSFDFKNPETGK